MQKPDKQRYDEEVVRLLPSSVSDIKVQKKNSFRFSLFIQDKFLIGVSDSTLTRFNLRKGTLVTPEILRELIKEEDTWALKEYFIRLLGRRDHARNELRDKARKKGYPLTTIEEVLDELTEKKYINNRSFAKKFAHDKFEFNKWGINKIRAELFKKGISEREINIVLATISDVDQLETVRELVEKNKRKFRRAEPTKRRKKIFDFLLRKGYSSSSILSIIDRLLESVEE